MNSYEPRAQKLGQVPYNSYYLNSTTESKLEAVSQS